MLIDKLLPIKSSQRNWSVYAWIEVIVSGTILAKHPWQPNLRCWKTIDERKIGYDVSVRRPSAQTLGVGDRTLSKGG